MSIIEVKNLSKVFDYHKKAPSVLGSFKSLFKRKKLYVTAVDNVSLKIHEGEFVGFVGPNGAGKTTTLKMLTGILHPSSGEVQVLGFKPYQRKPEFQKQFSLVMGQKNQLWWDLPPMESFLLNKAIYEIPEEQFQKNLEELVELLGVRDVLDIQVRKLSLGQRMKCELIAALLHSPKVIFLDEPTIGLDVVSQKNIRDFLLNYNQTKKATVILTSHYMEDIRRLCKRVIIINQGKIIYDGNYRRLTKNYADTKRLEIIFQKKVPLQTLEKYGTVIQSTDTSVSLSVPRATSTKITAEILEKLPVEDLTIHEKEMEEMVREIFKAGKANTSDLINNEVKPPLGKEIGM